MIGFFAQLLFAGAAIAQTVPPDTPAPASISGVVKDAATGSPIARISVQGGPVTTTTDLAGRYTLRNVPPGRYAVLVGAPGRTGAAYGRRAVTVGTGQERSAFDFLIPLKGTISGLVLDENKEPLPRVEVALLGREYFAGNLRYYRRNTTFANDQGEYRIQNVLPGIPYLILARPIENFKNPISEVPADPKRRKPATVPAYYPNSASPEGGAFLVLRPGEQREAVDIRLPRSPSYCIEGVLNLEGRPAGMDFAIHPKEMSFGIGPSGGMSGLPARGKSGADGKIRICDLPAGEYRLTAYSGDINTPDAFGTTLVAITNGDVRNITVAPQPRMPLRGEVAWAGDPPEKPVEARVAMSLAALHRSLGGLVGATSAIPGKFSFQTYGDKRDILMDDYSVNVSIYGVSGGLYIKDITYGNSSILGKVLRFGSAMPGTELRVIAGRDGGFVNTRVTDKDGNAVPDANVIVMPKDVRLEGDLAAARIAGQSDQNGNYASPALAPGHYYVLATLLDVNDFSPESVAKIWAARLKAKEVDLGPNSTVQVTIEPIRLD